MSTVRSGIVLVLGALALGGVVRAQTCQDFSEQMFETDRDDLGADGAAALVSSGQHLWVLRNIAGYAVFDLSDPADPVHVAEIETETGIVDLEISGDLGYFLTDSALTIYDVSDPTNPALLGDGAVSGSGRHVTLAGDVAVVATLSTLEVFDVSDPSDPVVVASVAASGYLDGVAEGDLLYFGTGAGLRIWSVATPSSPLPIGQSVEALPILHIEKRGEIVFGTGRRIGAWDVSDASAPVTLQIRTLWDADGAAMAIVGDHAFVSVSTWLGVGFESIDLSDPSHMVIGAIFLACDTGTFDLTGANDHLMAAFATGSLRTYDVSVPTLLEPPFHWVNNIARLRSIDANNDQMVAVAYFLNEGESPNEITYYAVWDLSGSNPSQWPEQIGTFAGSCTKVRTNGSNVGFVLDDGVKIWGTWPTLPVSFASDVLLDVGYAWVTRSIPGFVTAELGQGTNDILLEFPTSGVLEGITRLGPVIAMGDAVDGLLVVSRQPYVPTVLATNSDAGPLGEVATEGDLLYARSPDGSALHVFDASNFFEPHLISSFWDLQPGRGLDVLDGFVFMGGEDILQIVDATDPYAPQAVSTSMEACRTIVGVASWGGRVYVGSTAGEDGDHYTLVQGFWGPCENANTAASIVARSLGGLTGAPNPFRSRTSFSFGVDREASYALSIFDAAGRRVRRIDAGSLSRGSHELGWDGLGSSGRPVPAGVYFIRLEGGSAEPVARMVRIR